MTALHAALACVALVACNNTATTQEPPAAPPPAPIAEAAPPTTTEPAAANGRIVDVTFHSAALGVKKHVKVYLPASYDASDTRRYPVFYYLHGLTGDETNWITYGKLDETADRLGLDAIVVMPDGDDSFYADAVTQADHAACMKDGTGLLDPTRSKARTCVKDRKYETYIVKDLVDWVDANYRTIATREGRGIAGLSMGGFGALSLAMRNPDRFVAAASHSGVVSLLYDGPVPYERGKVKLVQDVSKAWGGKLGPIGNWVRSIFGNDLARWREHDPAILVSRLGPNAPRLYLDCGDDDELALHNHAMYLHELLEARKIDHEFWIGRGRHDFKLWAARLPNSLQFLRKHTTPAS